MPTRKSIHVDREPDPIEEMLDHIHKATRIMMTLDLRAMVASQNIGPRDLFNLTPAEKIMGMVENFKHEYLNAWKRGFKPIK